MQKAFTLIELLVVVLIIGILSAIALPQYQKAVIKTRYNTLKTMTHSIVNAEEIYYMANNEYTQNLERLDIDPGGTPNTEQQRDFDWGYCAVQTTSDIWYARCENTKIKMLYQVYFQRSASAAGVRDCVYLGTDAGAVQNAVCKSETGKTPSCGSSVCEVYY